MFETLLKNPRILGALLGTAGGMALGRATESKLPVLLGLGGGTLFGPQMISILKALAESGQLNESELREALHALADVARENPLTTGAILGGLAGAAAGHEGNIGGGAGTLGGMALGALAAPAVLGV